MSNLTFCRSEGEAGVHRGEPGPLTSVTSISGPQLLYKMTLTHYDYYNLCFGMKRDEAQAAAAAAADTTHTHTHTHTHTLTHAHAHTLNPSSVPHPALPHVEMGREVTTEHLPCVSFREQRQEPEQLFPGNHWGISDTNTKLTSSILLFLLLLLLLH